jgi:hypothetical protein
MIKKTFLFIIILLSSILNIYSYVNISSSMFISESFLGPDREVRLNVTNFEYNYFVINASNFVFNCNGNILYNSSRILLGVTDVASNNVTIKNCEFDLALGSESAIEILTFPIGVYDLYILNSTFRNSISPFNRGIDFDGDNIEGVLLKDLYFYNMSRGIYLENVYNLTAENLYFDELSDDAIILAHDVVNVTITASTFDNSGYSIRFGSTSASSPSNNFFIFNNRFSNISSISSANWTINNPTFFNYSGLGNIYNNLDLNGVYCFDDPDNLTCDYLAQTYVVSQSTSSSLFPVYSYFSSFILLFILFSFFF